MAFLPLPALYSLFRLRQHQQRVIFRQEIKSGSTIIRMALSRSQSNLPFCESKILKLRVANLSEIEQYFVTFQPSKIH